MEAQLYATCGHEITKEWVFSGDGDYCHQVEIPDYRKNKMVLVYVSGTCCQNCAKTTYSSKLTNKNKTLI